MRSIAVAAMGLALSGCDSSGPGAGLPPAFANAEARTRGRQLFLEHCALCHGERADGRGRRRSALSSRPVDFSDPSWTSRTTPRRTFEVIREGRPGTSMPAWKALDEQQTWQLVAYLHSLAQHGRVETP